MSIYSSRAISHYGYFGNAFNAFGATAFDLFTGGPGFQGADTFNNWTGTSRWAISADVSSIGYTPLSTAVLNQASKAWIAIDSSINPNDAAWKDQKFGEMKALIASADALAANHSITGDYNRSTTAALINAFKQLQTIVRQIATYKVTPMPPDSARGANDFSTPAANTPGSVNRNPSSMADDATSGAYAASSGTSPFVYLGVAVGGLALLGGIYALVRRRSSGKLSGYRRRRRSRR